MHAVCRVVMFVCSLSLFFPLRFCRFQHGCERVGEAIGVARGSVAVFFDDLWFEKERRYTNANSEQSKHET